jgi:UDP-glucose 4-epimerase
VRILVTGADGFIGRSLIPQLEGHEVWQLVRWDAYTLPCRQTVYADLKDGNVGDAVAEAQPDIIVHLAAVSDIGVANKYPVEAMLVNGVGTTRLVEAAQRAQVSGLVLASSIGVYGPSGAVEAHNAYAASKIAAEQSVRASGIPYVVMRPATTYGRGPVNMQKFVVEEAICQALTTGKVRLRDPNPVREFLFRDDHVDAYLRVIRALGEGQPDVVGETFDFSPNDPISIGVLAEVIARLTGVEDIAFTGERRNGDVDPPVLPVKARELLGWSPRPLIEGLEQAIGEWKVTLEGQHAHSLVVA